MLTEQGVVLRKIIIVILSLVPFTCTRAQIPDETNFGLYSVKDGLSNNDVWSLAQDRYGYIWIATRKGLNRFDGKSFLQFYADSSNQALVQDWVFRLKWLDDERLAILGMGLHIINTRTLEGRNMLIPPDTLKHLNIVNNVRDVVADKQGNIIMVSSTGLYQFNKKNELTFRYDHLSRKVAETNMSGFGINMIMADSNTVLIASRSGIFVYRIAEKDIHPLGEKDDEFFKEIATSKSILFLHQDETYFSIKDEARKELYIVDLVKKRKHLVIAPTNIVDLFDWRSRMIRLNDSVFAINGFEKGVYLIQRDKGQDLYTLQPKPLFGMYSCTPVLLDRSKRLWIGTKRGVLWEKRANERIEQISISPLSGEHTDNPIYSVIVSNDKIFAGAYEDVFVFDRRSLKLIKKLDLHSAWPGTPDPKRPASVITVAPDTLIYGYLGVWLNTRNLQLGKITLPGLDPLKPGGVRILYIFQDSRDNIYMTRTQFGNPAPYSIYFRGDNDHEFILRDFGQSELFRRLRYPTQFSEDPDGNVWFIGLSGIARLNTRSRQFDLILDSFPSIKIPRTGIFTNLVFDGAGRMYFGVRESGLVIYDPASKEFTQLTRGNGLPDNNLTGLFLLKDKLWFGSEIGVLANYDLASKKITTFNIEDTVTSDHSFLFSFHFDSIHHQLYVTYNTSLFRFDPDKLAANSTAPLFFVDHIKIVDGKTIYHPGGQVELSYKQSNLILNLAAINFDNAKQQQFAYRFVKNGNEPWQQIGAQQSILFNNLSKGSHLLQLKAYTKTNTWPEQIKEIKLIVHPPFWQTLWFIALTVALILAIIYWMFSNRIKSVRLKANIDKQMAELEIKGLHAQMNPHFIFNSLNSIKEMILGDEKQNASRYLSKFAQLIRTNLDQSRQTFITVKQCIDHLRQYLEMEKIRFEQFNYAIEVEEDLPEDIRMAPMLIQPVVENAIWHGLRDHEGEKRLDIRFYRSGKQLACEIEDNGIGIRKSMNDKKGRQPTHRSLGITSIHERLKVLNEKYQISSSIEINDKSELSTKNGSGTLVVFRFTI